ncbi:hypothetical protein E8E14_003862 [Neopestalotiopsis sp. 37M]|nr:hypothetical protein E8E14_003862 [Neopestalotiopsis sp. 37M]
MTCSNIDGELAPFCGPANKTEAKPGDRVIVTWDPSFFTNSSVLVQIQADFSPSSGSDPTPQDDDGFTSNSLRAGTGSYSWDISSSVLNSTSATGVDAQLYIVAAATDGENTQRTLGPLVRVVPASSTGDDSNVTSGPNLAAIIVPVVVGVLLLIAIAGFLLKKRRDPGWKLSNIFGMGSREGYGSRKSRIERSMGAGAGGLQMGNVESSRPQDGRNVFREEMQRQQAARV